MGIIIEKTLECTSFEGLSRLLIESGYTVPDHHYQRAVTGYRRTLIQLGLDGTLEKGSDDLIHHHVRVATYAATCANMLGLKTEEKRAAVLGARYHDCGKIGFDLKLINGGRFTDAQKREVQTHCIFGAYILNTGSEDDILVARTVGYHHENVDGSGYVDGLRDVEIPVAARILRIVDSFDCMRSEKPYAKQRTLEDALAELHVCEGKQFDVQILDIFDNLLRKDGKIKEIAGKDWTKIFHPPSDVSNTSVLE